jgi:hypothetical protein
MDITNKEIREDIQSFQDRIYQTKQKLADLPVGSLSPMKHKAREKTTRDLFADIKHYETIIGYAQEGLNS